MTDRLTPDGNRSDAERRVANSIRLGVVEEADYARARVRVRSGETLTGWLPFATLRAGGDKTWHPVEVGEQVIFAAPNGDLRQAVVLAAVNSGKNAAPGDRATLCRTVYEDGTSITYDREAHTYLMDVNSAGGITINIGGSSIFLDDGKILLSSNGSTLLIDGAGIKLEGGRIDLN
jgi:phage baseplate assembly protein V